MRNSLIKLVNPHILQSAGISFYVAGMIANFTLLGIIFSACIWFCITTLQNLKEANQIKNTDIPYLRDERQLLINSLMSFSYACIALTCLYGFSLLLEPNVSGSVYAYLKGAGVLIFASGSWLNVKSEMDKKDEQ